MPTTVYIVDDDVTFARGLARLVGAAGWKAEVCACADDFLAPGRISVDEPGCVLLDVRMPGMRGPELQRVMIERHINLPVVFLTGHGDVGTSVDAMKLGAVDFLEKPVRAEKLVAAIRTALVRDAAHRAKDRELREVEARIGKLTRREREVMEHVVAGRLNKQICFALNSAERTVKTHRARVMDKMQAHSVAELVRLAAELNAAGISLEPVPGD